MIALIFWRIVAFMVRMVFKVRPLVLLLVGIYLVGCLVGFLFAQGGAP